MKKIKGFTIVETLIVVVVMMVLGAITWNQFETAKAKARDIQRKSDLHQISKAIQLYYADYGHLPAVEIKNDPDINKLWGKTFKDSKDYIYLEMVPSEKYLIDKPYCYEVDNQSKVFKLFAELEVKSDSDCKDGQYTCGERSYCYTDTIYVNNSKS